MKITLLLLLEILPFLCLAQTGQDSLRVKQPLETDRPDQTESSSVVPLGTLQVESGFFWQVERRKGQKITDVLYPTVLLRVGLLERMELRFITEYCKSTLINDRGATSKRGLNAMAVGTKIYITEEKGLIPEISLLGHLTLPSGSSEFRPTYVAPDFRLSLSHTLTNSLCLGYNLGYHWDGGTPEGTGIYTLSLAADISERSGAYVEVFGDKPEKGSWCHSADAGFTFSPRYNIQLDVSMAVGITSASPDYYLNAGLSFRIPR
ncbi:transporter [Rufibacter roseolus]|uniref:transporter n=1 Tax=Rufibacter roseolus TaxID=2817375 RepID=UPI001B306569|nr:transporter [Rufibacter roseolus]